MLLVLIWLLHLLLHVEVGVWDVHVWLLHPLEVVESLLMLFFGVVLWVLAHLLHQLIHFLRRRVPF
jgi:hypothetical protein